MKCWQVFKDDKQLEFFLQMTEEFSNLCTDEENYFSEDE